MPHQSPKPSDPQQFLAVGDRVRAVCRVIEQNFAGKAQHVHAEPEEMGTCIHTEKGFWPTVRFDRTGTATIVFPEEVSSVVVH